MLEAPAETQKIPLPSSSIRPSTPLAFIVGDESGISYLINEMLRHSGLTQAEAARRMGIPDSTIQQYRSMRRRKPSLVWISRLAAVCGARFVLEFPAEPRR